MKAEEDIFRIQVAEMDWDVGGMVYQPLDSSQTPVGPNGKKAGIFMLHGGTRDHRFLDPVARFLTGNLVSRWSPCPFQDGSICTIRVVTGQTTP